MAGRPWILAETTWKSVEATSYDVAVLPWGSTEAHNYHLPYATDTIQATHVAAEAARMAWAAGARVIVLPAIPFGVQTGQLDIPLCINLNPGTLAVVLGDVARTLAGQGIRRLVVLNGHGGNDFRAPIRELQPQVPLLMCTLNWWHAVDAKPFFDDPGDHAGELETSVMQSVVPELVLPLEQAGDGRFRAHRIRAFREGWAWTQRQWREVSFDTGVGDPRPATPEKGRRFVDAAIERVAEFLVELAAADPGALYEGD
jgi:creatinine amidohydrolase